MKVACPKCGRRYETDLGSSRRATIVCSNPDCTCAFECYVRERKVRKPPLFQERIELFLYSVDRGEHHG